MDKHAYLVIAHNEFDILNLLIGSLDDLRNDIYIHLDAKCNEIPKLKCKYSFLYFLPNRIDVRWGDYSVVEAEMQLFEYAYNMQKKNGVNYQYYHLISGVDFPLKNQDYIHDFFNKHNNKEFLGFYQGDIEGELRKKAQIYHLFPKSFSKERRFNIKSILRALFCRIQLILGYRRNNDIKLVRGTQWVSITNDFVRFLLSNRKVIYKRFHHTFCADEIYKHTICWNSAFRERIFNHNNEALGCVREINWVITENKSLLPSFTINDYERLIHSQMLFARKFDVSNIDVVKRLFELL